MDRVQRSPAASATIGACGPNVELRAVVGATIGACGPNEDVRDVFGAIAGVHGPNVEGMDVVEVCIASGAICDERAVVGASGANIGTCGSNEDVREVVGATIGAVGSEWRGFKDRPPPEPVDQMLRTAPLSAPATPDGPTEHHSEIAPLNPQSGFRRSLHFRGNSLLVGRGLADCVQKRVLPSVRG